MQDYRIKCLNVHVYDPLQHLGAADVALLCQARETFTRCARAPRKLSRGLPLSPLKILFEIPFQMGVGTLAVGTTRPGCTAAAEPLDEVNEEVR